LAVNSAHFIGPFLWYLIILFSFTMYVVLDGYDLGIGMLLLTERNDERRDEMMEIASTVWDGNESWIVLIAVALFGGFPLAFSIILPALYIPLIIMLFSLIFRGISFEFQAQLPGYSRLWGRAFGVGSAVVAFSQGVILGALVSGIPVEDGLFAGGPFDFLSPFSVLSGLTLMAFYGLLGAGWLAYKTEGDHFESARAKGRALAVAAFILLVVSLIAIPFAGAFSGGVGPYRLIFIWVLVVGAAIAIGCAYITFGRRDDTLPFLCTVPAVLSLIVAGASAMFPYFVAPSITIWQAASPGGSVNFLLVGVGLCIPIILIYNAYAYWVFRGKFELPSLSRAGEETAPPNLQRKEG
jgi:cytochrome d ubiquinol oxidase subunit II